MAVTGIKVDTIEPFAGGRRFGPVGAYEVVRGRFLLAWDPAAGANARITDLDRAERGSAGMVEAESDVVVLRPVETAAGNASLLYSVVNRGVIGSLPFDARPPSAFDGDPSVIAVGDGLLLRHGWTVAWSGWQWDIPTGAGLLGCAVPQALDGDGRPLAGPRHQEFQLMMDRPDQPLAASLDIRGLGFRPYPTAIIDDPDAILSVRPSRRAPAEVIDRQRWRFARHVDGAPVPDDSHVWLEGGFQAGLVYEVVYRTGICPVVGAGLLAVRDAVSTFRYGDGHADGSSQGEDPGLARGIRHVIAHGVSQSGRFLRQFLFDGLNIDEGGRVVFDGVNPHIAGSSRGEFNQRYGSPGELLATSIGHTPPFGLDDPAGGLLDRQRTLGGTPKVMLTNSGSEYWRGDGSTAHISVDGATDLPERDDTRVYYFAGTDHVGGNEFPVPGFENHDTLSPLWLCRAAILNLQRWVSEDVEPPASVVPRVADATAAARADVLAGFPTIPGVAILGPEDLAVRGEVDLGPDVDAGLARYPAHFGPAFAALVSRVDSDGNEIAGICSPELAVPLATHIPWNSLRRTDRRFVALADLVGMSAPFPRTPAEAASTGDPRRPVEQRYRDRDSYLTAVAAAADDLVAARLLLAEDVGAIMDDAARSYDAALAGPGR